MSPEERVMQLSNALTGTRTTLSVAEGLITKLKRERDSLLADVSYLRVVCEELGREVESLREVAEAADEASTHLEAAANVIRRKLYESSDAKEIECGESDRVLVRLRAALAKVDKNETK